MASASTHTTQSGAQRQGYRDPLSTIVLPDILHCVVHSWSDQRARFLQTVAEKESWRAKVCDDVQEFLRSVFQLDVPLTVVDLPPRGHATYAELREMATHMCGLKRSLLLVCGAENDKDEEIWARQIGAWAYLPGATEASSLRLVFTEARKALARKTSAYVEASGYR